MKQDAAPGRRLLAHFEQHRFRMRFAVGATGYKDRHLRGRDARGLELLEHRGKDTGRRSGAIDIIHENERAGLSRAKLAEPRLA
jgi:hypothetical protein